MSSPYRPSDYMPRGWKIGPTEVALPVADGAASAMNPVDLDIDVNVNPLVAVASSGMNPIEITNFIQFGATTIAGPSLSAMLDVGLNVTVPVNLTVAQADSGLIPPQIFIFYPVDITSVSPSSGHYDTLITITGTGFVVGDTTVTIGGQPARNVTVVNSTQITCNPPGLVNGVYDVVVSTSQSTNTETGGFTYSFTQINEFGIARTGFALPTGWQSVRVKTVMGAGGAGGQGFQGAEGTVRRGGGGGGGGGRIEELVIQRSDYPSATQYDVTLGQGLAANNGGASVFRLKDSGGNILMSLTANGGIKGNTATSGSAGTGGSGGSGSTVGITATIRNGVAGATGASTTNGGNASGASTTTGAPGGGGGGARTAANSNGDGGNGGNAPGLTGGAGGVGNQIGQNGASGAALDPPMGSGGGGGTPGNAGGLGGLYGAGAGGGGGSQNVATSRAGQDGIVWLQFN